MREVKVYLGVGLDEESIKDALNTTGDDGRENTLLFEVAHAVLTGHSDDRAEIHDVWVDEVSIDPSFPNVIHIEFTTSWSIYVGCRDKNSAGEENLDECATYMTDGNLVFMVPTPRRPANHC